MSLNLSAYQNQRFQRTFNVTSYASRYSGLGAAIWRMQIRPFAGSPVVTLDFMSAGSPQSANLTATYDGVANTVIFRAPTSIVAFIPAGTYYFDYGFTLASADFERVDGGTIEFIPGVTLAGVVGYPGAPTNADDTVTAAAVSSSPNTADAQAIFGSLPKQIDPSVAPVPTGQAYISLDGAVVIAQ